MQLWAYYAMGTEVCYMLFCIYCYNINYAVKVIQTLYNLCIQYGKQVQVWLWEFYVSCGIIYIYTYVNDCQYIYIYISNIAYIVMCSFDVPNSRPGDLSLGSDMMSEKLPMS